MIRSIEEYSTNAWPAQQTILYDGWVLRFANGYTRRANSVYPLYHSTLPVDEKITACEALYRAQGLPACFKMTPAAQPDCLDDTLAAHGYTVDAPTSVQTLDLSAYKLADAFAPSGSTSAQVEITGTPTDEWQEEFARLSGIQPDRRAAHEKILAAILLPCGYAAVRQESRLVACGLGVVQESWLGLFDIVTGQAFRRQGHARQLVGALLGWGKIQMAQSAYLQVMKNNPAALSLYDGLGFRELYPYWYRVKSLT